MPSPSGPITQMNNLRRLGEILRENPDTGTGVQIRALLWSLLNQHHLVNLWTLCSRLNDEPARLAAEVLTAALMGRLTDSQVKQTLIECGEMERWDKANTGDTMADTKSTLARALRATPPGPDHVRLASALRELERG
jgi:hypothetical protein